MRCIITNAIKRSPWKSDQRYNNRSKNEPWWTGFITSISSYNEKLKTLRGNVPQTTQKLLKSSEMMGLEVNQQKTKYMCITQTEKDDSNSNLKVDNLTSEKDNQFKYRRVNLNSANIMHEEIKNRLTWANNSYFSLLNLFKSKNLSYGSKKILYCSYLRPILTYGCETWSNIKENHQNLFERNILRKIYMVLYTTEKRFEERHNNEIQELCGRPNIFSYTRSKRLEWLGHVWRADDRIIKQLFVAEIRGKIPLGRPRTR